MSDDCVEFDIPFDRLVPEVSEKLTDFDKLIKRRERSRKSRGLRKANRFFIFANANINSFLRTGVTSDFKRRFENAIVGNLPHIQKHMMNQVFDVVEDKWEGKFVCKFDRKYEINCNSKIWKSCGFFELYKDDFDTKKDFNHVYYGSGKERFFSKRF